MLEQVARDTGSAFPLLIFSDFTPGAVEMWLISLEWVDKIPVLGAITLGCEAVVLSTWFILQRKEIIKTAKPLDSILEYSRRTE